MLPKEGRLSRKEIDLLKQKNFPVVQGKLFGLIFLPAAERKFGVIISAKVAKKAVDRNKIKRRLMAALRAQKPTELKSGWFLFLAKRTSNKAGFGEYLKEVEFLFSKFKK
jgi:ribonuclease P protein component